MNYVIVSGGLQTRFEELSCFPKILLPSKDGTPILLKQLEYFKGANSIKIVVNHKYGDMMKAFVRVNKLDVEVIVSTNANGSGNTLASVYDRLPKKNVMFFWSDILFESDKFNIDLDEDNMKDNAVIFTTDDNSYRYKIKEGQILNQSVSYDGNVPGIFWIKDISEVIPNLPQEETKDLIDFIQEKSTSGMITFSEQRIHDHVIEYKSLEEYKKIMETSEVKEVTFPTDLHISYDNMENMQVEALGDEEKIQLSYQKLWSNLLKLGIGTGKYVEDLPLHDDNSTVWTCDMSSLEGYFYTSKKDLTPVIKTLSKNTVKVSPSDNTFFLLRNYNGEPLSNYCLVHNMLEDKKRTSFDIDFAFMQNLIDHASKILIDNLANEDWVLTHGNINSHNVLMNANGTVKLINPKSRYENSAYCNPIVDRSEAIMVKVGLDEALRKRMIYKTDTLPELNEGTTVEKIAIYLHLLQMLPYFTTDIMKVNIIVNYVVEGLTKTIKEYYE